MQVRAAAARWLADFPSSSLDAATGRRLARGLEDYAAMQRFNADRPEAWNNLAMMWADRREWARAESALQEALVLAPYAAATRINLADVRRRSAQRVPPCRP